MKRKNEGYRLVAISCTCMNGMEISYSFDKDCDFFTLRLCVESDAQVESISSIYSYAFFYENEIKELFGVNIKNISLDFGGNLYVTAVETPFNNQNSASKENEHGK